MISDELIRQAVREYNEESMSTIPTESECDHTFSDRFHENMKPLLRKGAQPHMMRTLRMAASFAIVLTLTFGSVLALSPTARGSVLGWIFGQEENVYSYRATGEEDDTDTLITYSIAQIPEGYSLWQEVLGHSHGITIYADEASGRLFKILFAPNDGNSALFLIPESAQKLSIQLKDAAADFYQSNSEEESSCIVWVDPETDYLICIDGFFSQDALVDFAMNVVKKPIPRPQ